MIISLRSETGGKDTAGRKKIKGKISGFRL